MSRPLVVLLLFLLVLPGCRSSPAPQGPVPEEHRPAKEARLLWIPLDSRPVNTYEVALFGEAAGFSMLLPPAESLDWYASVRSDFPALIKWLGETAEPGDGLVLYTNNLLTGGLIASRDPALYADLRAQLSTLKETLSRLPPGRRIAVHVLPRGLPTQFLPDGPPNPDYRWHAELQERSELKHRLLQTGSEDDRTRLAQLERAIPPAAQQRYDELIGLNERILHTLQDLVQQGLLSDLVIGLDDARPFGMANQLQLKAAERAWMLGVADRVHLHLGADEIGFMLLAREALHRSGLSADLAVHYDQEKAPALLLPYEGSSLGESVELKLALLGARLEPDAAQQLFLHTVTAADAPAVTTATLGRIAAARAAGRGVTVVDVTSPGPRDHRFLTALREQGHLTGIQYSGWNTASNALGTGMAMAVLADLHGRTGATAEQVLALEAFRAVRFGYDWIYQRRKAEIAGWARQRGIDYLHFGAGWPVMNDHLKAAIGPEIDSLLAELLRPVQVDGQKFGICLERTELSYPWDRTFEILIVPHLKLHELSDDQACRN